MSAEDLNRTQRPFWLCRRCGHWSTSIEPPGEHTQTSHRNIPDTLAWHPIREYPCPTLTMSDDQADSRARTSYLTRVVEESDPDWDGLVFRRMYELPMGVSGTWEMAARRWTHSVCRGGYERWTATVDPGERHQDT